MECYQYKYLKRKSGILYLPAWPERGGLMPSSDEANEETTVVGFGSSPSRRGLKPITRKEYEDIAVEYFNRVPISRQKFDAEGEMMVDEEGNRVLEDIQPSTSVKEMLDLFDELTSKGA